MDISRTRPKGTFRLLGATALATIAIGIPKEGHAGCEFDSALGTVTCTGGNNGFEIQPQQSYDVTLEPGSQIWSGGITLNQAGTVTVENHGSLYGGIHGSLTGEFRFDNFSTVTGGVDVTGPQKMVLENTGVLHNGISLQSEAGAFLFNWGETNGGVVMGNGNDSIVYYAGAKTTDKGISTGDGNDSVYWEGDELHGGVKLGEGVDTITVAAGLVDGGIDTGSGGDALFWTGGKIQGQILMGDGVDNAVLEGLSEQGGSDLTHYQYIDGGADGDLLFWRNTVGSYAPRLAGWEQILVEKNSELTFNGDLTLGDSTTGTGEIDIDSSSIVYGGSWTSTPTVKPFTAGQKARVANAGTISIQDNDPYDRFRIEGDYDGYDGRLLIDTQLSSDGAPSDRLVLSRGEARGRSYLEVHNVNGLGETTSGSGILVVETNDGATTQSTAFTLGEEEVKAGVFEYWLFRGGQEAGTENNWYLRNTLLAGDGDDDDDDDDDGGGSDGDGGDGDGGGDDGGDSDGGDGNGEDGDGDGGDGDGGDGDGGDGDGGDGDGGDGDGGDGDGGDGDGDGGDGDGGGGDDGGTVIPEPELPEPPVKPIPPDPDQPAPPEPSDPTPPDPVDPPIDPGPDDSDDSVDTDGQAGTPIIRPEIPAYTLVPRLAERMGIRAIGTFHKRRGDQLNLGEFDPETLVWARLYGSLETINWEHSDFAAHDLNARFDGDLFGVQVGADLWEAETDTGGFQRAGLYYSYAGISGDVEGNVLLQKDYSSGTLDMAQHALGIYWTRVEPSGWYFDAVLQYGRLDASTASSDDVNADFDGQSYAVSLETGRNIPLDDHFSIEPQAQLIWQKIEFDDSSDRYSDIRFNDFANVTGRIGARLEYRGNHGRYQGVSHVGLEYWHTFDQTERVSFNDSDFEVGTGLRSVDLTAGTSLALSQSTNAFFNLTYNVDVDHTSRHIVGGIVGVKYQW